ncbi:putative aminotransferase [Lachnellula hyalina]|uniref:Putative aminotransferase n=1 Tax=Lachnellula hyalina TaxID=1316788 RepID=A0A8H8U0J8_9HELO|nr:putative aminotransferase [Lachnellula hyalina]TVY27400.1 putative aminotransferase [Lachnellula hyalina]
MEAYGLSRRGAANVEAIWPRISTAATERERATEDSYIDVSTSENWLIREELIELYKKAVDDNLSGRHLSYPNGFAGDTELLDALAQFFNSYFKPYIHVLPGQLATAPGAAFSLDALLYNICEKLQSNLADLHSAGGFDWLLNVKAGVQPVFVTVETFDDVLTSKLIPALENTLTSSPYPIKGLLFTNPHNPFGQCYPSAVIMEVIKFCNAKGIHFISDEIYALSKFECPDVPEPVPFTSALQLDIEGMGCNLSRVHTIWSLSKDLGSSGLRMGCCVTQGNRPLVTGLALVSNTQMSSLTAIAATSLLRSTQLPSLLVLNSERLAQSYERLTSVLRERGVSYIPSNMGPFVFARISPTAQSWAEEVEAMRVFKTAGVVISAGRGYHVVDGEKGWARINFAMPPKILTKALKRLIIGFDGLSMNREAESTQK